MHTNRARRESTEGKNEEEMKIITSFVPFKADFSATVGNLVYIQFVANLLCSQIQKVDLNRQNIFLRVSYNFRHNPDLKSRFDFK